MKKKCILFLLILITLSSCMSSQNQITPTPSPRPRPISEYDMGIWHEEIEEIMADYISTILTNSGDHIDFQIEILPATSLQDEIIFFYYLSWPEDTQLGLVYWYIFSLIEIISNGYDLNPQAVIMAEFSKEPFGGFYEDNENLRGFCHVPWSAIPKYTENSFEDIESARSFTDQWDCSYK